MATITRPETTKHVILTTVPSGNTNYTLALPAGTYLIGFCLTTNIANITGFNIKVYARNCAGTATNDVLPTSYPGTAATTDGMVPSGTGAKSRYFVLIPGITTLPLVSPVPLPNGLAFTVTVGSAAAGSTCELVVMAARMA